MLVMATFLCMMALYCVLMGIKEAIRTAILGRFDSATIVMIIIGIGAGALGILLAIWREKKAEKKRTKEEIERDKLLEANGTCFCARCGMNLKLIPLTERKRDIKWIDGKLYCGVCAANCATQTSVENEREVNDESQN